MRIQSLSHSTYQHQYHIVWGTKYRRKVLKPYVLVELKKVLYATAKKYPTLRIIFIYRLRYHQILPCQKIYIEKDGIWSVGYFSSTVGLNEEKVKRCIQWQTKKDVPQKTRLF